MFRRHPRIDPAAMRGVSKRRVLMLQVITVSVVAFTITVTIIASMYSDYLVNEGLPVLVFFYVIPVILAILVTGTLLKRTFTTPARRDPASKHAAWLAANASLTGSYFPEGTSILRATPELRPDLAKLHGELIAGSEKETAPAIKHYIATSKPRYIGTCGDVISKSLIDAGILPDLVIVDGMTCRHELPALAMQGFEEQHETRNDTGGITKEAWLAIKAAIESGRRTAITITGGEEDLLLIPMVLLAPNGAIMAYGQPPITDLKHKIPAGAVMVRVTPLSKARFAAMLDRFSPGPGAPREARQ